MTSKPRSTPMPSFIPPMKAEAVKALPPLDKDDRTNWGYEPKIDGHRLQLIKNGRTIRIRLKAAD